MRRTQIMQINMDQPKQAKEKVRGYIERRQIERRQNVRAPLHDPQQIREEIGWDLADPRQGDRRDHICFPSNSRNEKK